MGVSGLTSYVEERKDEFFSNFQLHDCTILLDGNSVASQIYGYSKSNYAFGGDYDKYAYNVEEFIFILQKCNVKPIFVFDGAYEDRKLKTVIERINVNVRICSQYKDRYKQSKCFPLLLRDVFRDVLRSHNATIVQSDFEADQELIILSRLFQWPIVSYDSDFLLADIDYIPFNSLQLMPLKLRNNKKDKKYYINCKIYNVNTLLNKFGGLTNKITLPLLSALLGNDYITGNTFQGLLALPGNASYDKKLEKMIKWLQNVKSVDDGIKQMVSVVDERRRKRIRNVLITLVEDSKKSYSNLIIYIPKHLFLDSKEEDYYLSIPGCTRRVPDLSKDLDGKKKMIANKETKEIKSVHSEQQQQQQQNDSFTVSSLCTDVNKLSLDKSVPGDKKIDIDLPDNDDEDVEDRSDITEEDQYIESNKNYIFESDCDIDSFNLHNKSSSATDTADEEEEDEDEEEGGIYTNKPPILNRYFMNNARKYDMYSMIIPGWLRTKLNKGIVSPSIMNILCSRRIFINSQAEDYSSPPSHEIALPILKVIVGLLMKSSKEEKTNALSRMPKYVKCHARIKSCFTGSFDITPLYSTTTIPKLPLLVDIPTESVQLRATVLLDTAGVGGDVNLTEFPEDWILFVIALIFWVKHCKSPEVGRPHIRAVIVCIIYLYVIDRQIGYIRIRKTLVKSYQQLKLSFEDIADQQLVHSDGSGGSDYRTILDILKAVSKSDCFQVANSLLDFHKVDDTLLQNRKLFDIKFVHAFAQLQSCLQYIMILNTILDSPFASCQPSKFLSCTFLYNFYHELSSRKFIDDYVTRTLFSKAPTINRLYRKLVSILDHYLLLNSCDHSNHRTTATAKSHDKSKKRKKRRSAAQKTKSLVSDGITLDNDENDEDNDGYFDPNNKYSILVDVMAH